MTPDLQKIHDTSMAILEKTGMIFSNPAICDTISRKGVMVSNHRVFFTEKDIMEWISKAPGEFSIKAPNPLHDIVIGGDHVEFLPGYGATQMVTTDGSVRNATITDYMTFLKLTHVCAHFNVNGGPLVQPGDNPVSSSMPVMVYLTHRFSDKCLVVPNGNKQEMQLLMDMLNLIYGRSYRLENAVAITILNPISPLLLDKNASDILISFAENNQPLIVTAAPMAGTTGPMSLAGSIALANAEVLATIAVHQMINPGAPVVYGARASVADMRTGSITIGNAERTLCSIYSCRMAKAYGLPCRAGGAETDAATVNAQSGFESMMNLMPSVLEKMNLVVHSAGILGGFGAMSVEKFIVDLEMVGMVKRLAAGMDTSTSCLALEVVDAVGPGGNFMMHDHTLARCRSEARLPQIGSRGLLGNKSDQDDFIISVQKTKSDLLDSYVYPDTTRKSTEELYKFLKRKGYSDHLPAVS